jgi:Possible lysine decarboxylase
MAREVGHNGLTKLHVVRSMHKRKALMADRSDAFVALPGGFGTLEEFCKVVTWTQLPASTLRCSSHARRTPRGLGQARNCPAALRSGLASIAVTQGRHRISNGAAYADRCAGLIHRLGQRSRTAAEAGAAVVRRCYSVLPARDVVTNITDTALSLGVNTWACLGRQDRIWPLAS